MVRGAGLKEHRTPPSEEVPSTEAEGLHVALETDGDRYFLRLAGELDLSTSELLTQSFPSIHGPVWVDCEHLTFVDSNGFAKLVELHKRTGSTVLCRATPEVRDALRVLNLYGDLAIVEYS
jgi:anti-anti-sigma factor